MNDLNNDDFPRDEWDYYLKLSEELRRVGDAMINCNDPEEGTRLSKRYMEIQNWMSEISFLNIWDY